ncbi:Fcf1-domain-containing protein [Hyaloraphidium curvatum]|nr:Fcf1-domain-containing protein [Hyaloraphidium curvatum]
MRVKRAKSARRRMAVYHHAFGFREPYQVLLDGNFVHAALAGRLDPRTQLPKVLAGTVRPMTTQCVLAEIRALGPDFGGTALAVKRLEKRRCPHTGKPVDAATCILGIVGEDNKHRYCVATQDLALRKRLREVPGTPLVLISKNVVVLESPSPATEHTVAELEQAKTMPVDFEKKVLKAEGLDIEAKAEEPAKKKKKRKEPNPLSIKKPKKLKAEPAAGAKREWSREPSEGPAEVREASPHLPTSETEYFDAEAGGDVEEAAQKADADGTPANGTGGKRKRPRKPRIRRKRKKASEGQANGEQSAPVDDGSGSDSD